MIVAMWTAIVPSIIGLLGVLVGAFMVRGNERGRRRLDFVERQLRDLYSPLHSLRQEIAALSELRVRIERAADGVWRELCATHPVGSAPDHTPFEKIIDYENEQLKAVLLPAYDKMLQTLRDNFYLAEESTRQYLPILIEYLEVWRRFQKKSIPGEVIRKLGHGEAQLHPFYADLETTFKRLRETLASGQTPSSLTGNVFNPLAMWRSKQSKTQPSTPTP
jgi:hypothetical protein